MLTWCEIRRDALGHNLNVLRQALGVAPEFMAVVKANAYGHGLREVAPVCAAAGITWFGVVDLDEALVLREMLGPAIRVLILGYIEPQEIRRALEADVRLGVFDEAHAAEVQAAAEAWGKPVRIHLKVDTGMGRHGIDPEKAPAVVKKCQALQELVVEGLWTHLAQADAVDPTYTELQLERWTGLCADLARQGLLPPQRHAANSAGALLYPAARGNMVRCGIALYGLWPNPVLAPRLQALGADLRPILTWKSRLVQIKRVPAQTPIGYGSTYITSRPTLLGVVGVGYADGYDRRLSNRGQVLVHGARCPVRGRVCMKHIVVDLGPAAQRGELRVGEEVVLLGPQGGTEIPADEMASWLGTINYEVTARLPERLPRWSLDP